MLPTGVIDYNPLTISLEARLPDAIQLMYRGYRYCQVDAATPNCSPPTSSCVIVVEHQRPIGMLTQRDVVRLVAQGNLAELQIAQVMTRSLLTQRLSDCQDALYLIQFLNQHKIHHLPIISDAGELIGLVTACTLQQALQSQLEKQINERNQILQQYQFAEAALQHRLQFEALLTQISTRFIALQTEEIDAGIVQALQAIAEFTQVEYAYILQCSEAEAVVCSHEWCAAGLPSFKKTLNVLSIRQFPWVYQQIQQGDVLQIKSLADLPLEAQAERRLNRALHIDSSILLPLTHIQKIITVFGLSVVHPCKIWRDEDVELLKTLSTIFVNILNRQQTELAFHQRGTFLQQILETTQTNCWEYDLATEQVAIFNSSLTNPIHLPRTQALARIHSDDQEKVLQALQTAIAQHDQFQIEYRYHNHPNRNQWYLSIGNVLVNDNGLPTRVIGTSTNITQRKQTKAALRQAHQELTYLIENSPLAVIRWDHDHRVQSWSPRAQEIFGWTAAEVVGQQITAWKFIYEDDLPQVNQVIAQLLQGKPSYWTCCNRNYRKDGSVVYCEWHNSVLIDESGQLVSVLSLAHDVSDRHQAEEQLRTESNFRQAIENSIVEGIAAVDSQGRQVYVNPAFCQMVGWSAEELLGAKPPFVYWPPEEIENITHAFQVCLEGKRPAPGIELRFCQRTGERFDVLLLDAPVKDQNGEIIAWLASVYDITERKRVEKALQQSQEQLRLITDSLPACISYVDAQRRYQFVNRTYEEWFGMRTEEIIGQPVQSIIGNAAYASVAKLLDQVLSGQPTTYESLMPYAYGGDRYISALLVPDWSDTHEVKGYFALVTDITDQKQIEASLRESLQEKEILLSEVHHRVKNNLQIIYSLLDLQANRIADPHIQEALRNTSGRIRSMVLVHESLYRSQNFACIHLSSYMHQLVNQLLQTYQPVSREVVLCIDVDSTLTVSLDQAIPFGLLLNELVTNAIKYGLSDGIGRLEVSLEAIADHLELIVSNSGDTLPPGFDLSRVTTMGLKLTLMLVEQLHGSVEIERGNRTLFKIIFPK